MSSVLNMVRGASGTYSVPAVHSGMVRERKTAQAARKSGLLNKPFGKRGTTERSAAFGKPKPDFNGWTRGDKYVPDRRSGPRYPYPTRLVGLTPAALAKTVGQALAPVAAQMLLDWADPPKPLEFTLPGQGANFQEIVETPAGNYGINGLPEGYSNCGGFEDLAPGNFSPGSTTIAYYGRGAGHINLMPNTSGCTTIANYNNLDGGLAFPPVTPTPYFALYSSACFVSSGGTDCFNDAIPFRAWSWPDTLVGPVPEPEVTFAPAGEPFPVLPPQHFNLPDPRAPYLPLRQLDPFTAPGIGGTQGIPAMIPYKHARGRGRYGTPSTRAPDLRAPGITITPGGITPSPPHNPVKPAPGEKEVKRRIPWKYVKPFKRLQKKLFHPLTEAGDAIGAIYDALECGQKGLTNPAQQAQEIYNNIGCLNIPKMLYNLAYNQAEDAVVGQGFKELEKASKRLGVKGPYKFYQPTLR